MICVSLRDKSLEEIFSFLDNPAVEMAEIRLDLCPLSEEEIDELFSCTDKPLVATCRIGSGMDETTAGKRLTRAILSGAQFADLEVEAPPKLGKDIFRKARQAGTTLIRSFHDFKGTPPAEELAAMLDKCRRFGGEIVKIVTTARCAEDWERVKALYEGEKAGSLVAFCMGAEGRQSRFECLEAGAPFTYASASEGQEAADGQIPFLEMTDRLYGAMPLLSEEVLPMPCSKSFAQRAIIAAALAQGTSNLGNYTPCDDSEAAIGVAEALGAKVIRSDGALIIEGTAGKVKQIQKLDVGESGLLTRLMIPLVSALLPSPVVIEGHGTLPGRPLTDAASIMASFGTVLSSIDPDAPRGEVRVPLQLSGSLLPGKVEISGKAGSQLISGLLMALPLQDGNSLLRVSSPRSLPYMFITADVLRRFGIRTGSEMEGDDDFAETRDWSLCTAVNFKMHGGQCYKAADFDLEADWSAAAPFLVAGAVFGCARLSGLDTSSLQADLSIIDILVQAGVSVSQDEDGCLNVCKSPLNAFETDLNNSPDLFPSVAMLAVFCPGQSRIAGVGRLHGKESDRASALLGTLQQMGVDVSVEGDEMVIEGIGLSQRLASGRMLRGGSFTSFHDHRMVMALSIAALGASSPVVIDDTDCVSKSFPGFAELWRRFCGSL